MQMPTARNIDNLLKDLREVLTEVKNSPAASGDMVALYGTYSCGATDSKTDRFFSFCCRCRPDECRSDRRDAVGRGVHRYALHDQIGARPHVLWVVDEEVKLSGGIGPGVSSIPL